MELRRTPLIAATTAAVALAGLTAACIPPRGTPPTLPTTSTTVAAPCSTPSSGATAGAVADDESGAGNDTVATAQVLPGASRISGSDGDRDWYRFTLPADAAVTTSFTRQPTRSGSTDPTTNATLFRDSALVGEFPSDVVGTIPTGASCQVLAAGTYVIVIRDADLVEGDAYTLLVEPIGIV